ncbi:MAG TPA: aldo/keto reductase [Clostridia bacterium]|nr:aldo/keto reductase [Clostridia bacterium]
MKYRILGRTNLEVSVIGFGGIMLNNKKQNEANQIVKDAIESGINIFDVGPTYGDAQKKMGPAIKSFRNDVVLTCKTEPDNTKDEVKTDLENSLEVLGTDYFDVYQLHEVTNQKDLNQALGHGGALEAIVEAKKKGLVNFIGFSAHNEWAAIKLMNSFDFDTVMFPINWNYWFNKNQGPKLIEKAQETNKGILAIKSLAQRRWHQNEDKQNYNTWYKPIFDNDELAQLALRFTLSQDIDTAISPGDIRMLNKGLNIFEQNKDNLELTKRELIKLKGFIDEHGGQLYPIP